MFKALIVAGALLATATVAHAQERWNLVSDADNRFCALRYQLADNILLSMGLHATYGLQLDIALPGSGSARQTSATLGFIGGNFGTYRFPARYDVRRLLNDIPTAPNVHVSVTVMSWLISTDGFRQAAQRFIRCTQQYG